MTNHVPVKNPEVEAIDWSAFSIYESLQKPGSTDIRNRLIKIYLDSSPVLMEMIRKAVVNSDGPALAKAAHSLKSCSKNVGANIFSSLCAELEQISKNLAMEKASGLLGRAEEQYGAVVHAFHKVLHPER